MQPGYGQDPYGQQQQPQQQPQYGQPYGQQPQPYGQPYGGGGGQPPAQIDNNMTMSIISIFLFWPTAIPAIINASKVNPALQAGDYATAQQAATESKKWSKISLIVGIVSWSLSILGCICYFVAFASMLSSTSSY